MLANVAHGSITAYPVKADARTCLLLVQKTTYLGAVGLSVKCQIRKSMSRQPNPHSALMPAALMIGHHFPISACWCAASASGVCLSRGQIP